MGLYRTFGDEKTLKNYIQRAEDMPERKLDGQEAELFFELKRTVNSGYRCGKMIGCYIVLINRLPENFDIIRNNLSTARRSIEKQAGLLYSCKTAFSKAKPDGKETDALKRSITRFDRRQEWIKKTVIEAATDLTPIKEYIKIVGEKRFDNELRDMINNRADTEEAELFAFAIIETVNKNGMGDEYKDRFIRYTKRWNEIENIREEEKNAEKKKKAERNRDDCETLTHKCTSVLTRKIETLSRYEPLGFTTVGRERILKEGNGESHIVVLGMIIDGSFRFRYLGKDGRAKPNIGSANIYTEMDAENAAARYMHDNRGRYAMPFCIR